MLRLLTQLFLRRFLDNDLISPGGDTHVGPSHALAGVCVAGLMVFLTVMLKYSQFRLQWEEVADRSFDDAAFYVATSMILFGLAATIAWDAFYLDSRDQFVLGSLPLSPRLLAVAKLAALGVFLVALTIAANLVPLLFAPALMMRPVKDWTFGQWSMLTRAQAAAAVGAGVWSALTVVAFRGALGHILPVRFFRRVSPVIQGALVVVFLGWFVLLPQFLRSGVNVWNTGGWTRDASPPFWFIGVHRAIVGRPLNPMGTGPDPASAFLAGVALTALGATLVAVIVLYLLWPPRLQLAGDNAALPQVHTPSLGARLGRAVLSRLFVARNVEKAIFAFMLKGFWRSGVHRMYLAAAAGTGFAWAIGGFFSIGRIDGGAWSAPAAATLHVQLVLILFTAAAVRLGVGMPVSLKANWSFRVTEHQAARPYEAGTRLAAFTIAAWPVVVLAPVHCWLWGWSAAGYHALVGLLYTACLVELLFVGWTAVPLAAPFVSGALRLKTRWPIYVFAPTLLAGLPALLEHALLQRGWAALLLPAALGSVACATALVRNNRERRHPGLVFEQPPLDAFQTLAIFE